MKDKQEEGIYSQAISAKVGRICDGIKTKKTGAKVGYERRRRKRRRAGAEVSEREEREAG